MVTARQALAGFRAHALRLGKLLAARGAAEYTVKMPVLQSPVEGSAGVACAGRLRFAPRPGPCAISACEPRQGRKAAALSRS